MEHSLLFCVSYTGKLEQAFCDSWWMKFLILPEREKSF